jgi:glycosyltransferase involved in cell wall biosynthesis
MKILFLSRWFPYPPNNGSKLRIYHLLRGLAQRHDVSLLSFAEPGEPIGAADDMHAPGKVVEVIPWKAYVPSSWKARLGYLHSAPRSIIDTFSRQMAAAIQNTCAATRFDLVIASQIQMAAYLKYFSPVPAIFEEIELGAVRDQVAYAASLRQRVRAGLMWSKLRGYLARLLRGYRACTVVSEREHGLLVSSLERRRPPRIEVVPNGIELAAYGAIQRTSRSNVLIFSGALSYSANFEAMSWFLSTVYPLVQAEVPSVELIITGDTGGKQLPPARSVHLTGPVPDVRPLIASAQVSLAPLLTGGGTRLKILEAMALRTPVVSTSKGAEGLAVEHGAQLLMADTPEAFARAVVCLLKERSLHQQLAECAYQFIREQHDWAVVLPRFVRFIEQVA